MIFLKDEETDEKEDICRPQQRENRAIEFERQQGVGYIGGFGGGKGSYIIILSCQK